MAVSVDQSHATPITWDAHRNAPDEGRHKHSYYHHLLLTSVIFHPPRRLARRPRSSSTHVQLAAALRVRARGVLQVGLRSLESSKIRSHQTNKGTPRCDRVHSGALVRTFRGAVTRLMYIVGGMLQLIGIATSSVCQNTQPLG